MTVILKRTINRFDKILLYKIWYGTRVYWVGLRYYISSELSNEFLLSKQIKICRRKTIHFKPHLCWYLFTFFEVLKNLFPTYCARVRGHPCIQGSKETRNGLITFKIKDNTKDTPLFYKLRPTIPENVSLIFILFIDFILARMADDRFWDQHEFWIT